MTDLSSEQEAVELLQRFGLKEYEARSFVALSRVPHGTAKDISEISEVPRTRVYDATGVLESKGLVEVQHSNPQVFRAVSIEEAAEILRDEYESRTERLVTTLQEMDAAEFEADEQLTQEVWALSGPSTITQRTRQLLDEADHEVVIVLGHESVVDDALLDRIQAGQDRGVTVLIGTVSDEIRERVEEALPEATVFASGLEWLQGSQIIDSPLPLERNSETDTGLGRTDDGPTREGTTEISRLLLVDRGTILVSSYRETESGGLTHEQAIFGRGFENGLVTIVRRLMATGLLPTVDPGQSTSDES
ncbi:TrmB family transcriptional regulator [Saliphagus sp. LR7]|uniref:TrmB family transcriptional regulator n=1 Tax=Saliphagus sp. LR7 TaxID=2282654 RepID=UPI000DF810B3|nr:helix-turn-helix domain-containing protein [Saliphagus sp. LR7]